MAKKRRVQANAMSEPKFQPIERRLSPTALDAVPRGIQKMATNACLLGVFQLIFAVFAEAGPGSRADREQTLLRVQCLVGSNKKSTLDNLFGWRFNCHRLFRMKMNAPDPSIQITTLLAIVEKLTAKDPLTVREILGELEPHVSVKTLTITDGILGMTHAAKQECDDGTWILADTGANHETLGLMRSQKISASARPCTSCQVFSRCAELLLSAI